MALQGNTGLVIAAMKAWEASAARAGEYATYALDFGGENHAHSHLVQQHAEAARANRLEWMALVRELL